jgi:predicted nucleotidyltransferase
LIFIEYAGYPQFVVEAENGIVEKIVSRLSAIKPYKIVLLGSRATGNDHDDSDIDLLVILDSNNISQSYEEKMAKKISVRNQIAELSQNVAVDLVVYTKAEYRILEEANGSFFHDFARTGKTLYEKTGAGVA